MTPTHSFRFVAGLLGAAVLGACPGPAAPLAAPAERASRRPSSPPAPGTLPGSVPPGSAPPSGASPAVAGGASPGPVPSSAATLFPSPGPSALRPDTPAASVSPAGPPAPPSQPPATSTESLPTGPVKVGAVAAAGLVVSTFSGGTEAAPNPAGYLAGDAVTSRYGKLEGLAIDAADALYLCEGLPAEALPGVGGVLRKVRPDGRSVVLGGDRPGPPRGDFYVTGDALAVTRFDGPLAPHVLPMGGLAVLSDDLFTLRAIAPAGGISLVAWVSVGGSTPVSPYLQVPAGALTHAPKGLARDSAGNWYISDAAGHVIRKLGADGRTTLFAGGTGTTPNPKGYLNGSAAQARFNEPWGLAFDSQGNLLVSERGNGVIRRIAPDGSVTTFAGPAQPSQGYRNGPAAEAEFASPMGLAIDAADVVFVAERDNHVIRRITPAGQVSTLAGGDDAGTAGAGFRNGPAAQARFDLPVAVAIDSQGALYVCDQGNHVIRKVHPR